MFSFEKLLEGAKSGLIDSSVDSSKNFQPHLVLNDLSKGTKTLEFVLENLSNCIQFRFAVAFVTRSGVACLHQTLKEFSARGGSGQILISKYLNFSDPHAINLLKSFQNIDVRFISSPNYHGKTFLFEFDEFSRVLIGSSNLTQDALGRNTEVNVSATVAKTSSLYRELDENLNSWFTASEVITEKVLAGYFDSWSLNKNRRNKEEVASAKIYSEEDSELITPNAMQITALENLNKIRESGQARSLVISATGTGKTVLSALDVKQSASQRLLFVVHRLNIAKKAMNEFKKVFGSSKTMGIYSAGEELNTEADFLFSTVQTINTEHHLKKFKESHFDYIIIDETHRAGAKTYKNIIDYFKPKFLLGMTATPERTDNFDIFSLFNHSIAYEIRLQKALEADLLVPFHYFGIADISVGGKSLDEKSDFNNLISEQRVNHIIDALEEYGCDTAKPKGLIFCSRTAEAKTLSSEFNAKGFKTCALTGEDDEDQREVAIRKLESDADDGLDYIFTVDIFNEGIDIPAINQVVMLRPTSSAIIFVQQLGRGLRKSKGKDYLTVLDFIGNYENNYLIPVALFGDASFNKDKLRRILNAGSALIPGASSISFESIAKDLIFKSIDSTKLDTRKQLSEAYKLLQFRIGRPPMMMDFINHQSRDPYQYVAEYDSILKFSVVSKAVNEIAVEKLDLIKYLGKHVLDGKRVEDAVILKLLQSSSEIEFEDVKQYIKNLTGFKTSDDIIKSAIHSINLNYITERLDGSSRRVSEIKGYKLIECVDSKISSTKFLEDIKCSGIYSSYFYDLVECCISTFVANFNLPDYVGGFKRGEKYSRKDVFRILNWDKRPNEQNVGGYAISPDGTNCPIFATYHKSENISLTTKYEDRFINQSHLVYMSKSKRNLLSNDVSAIRNHKNSNMRIPFFAKKNDDEGLDFYYLGDLTSIPDKFESTFMSSENGQVSVVKMEFIVDKPVESNLYKYITGSNFLYD
jgi:superfamily II DNA or RNA helicase/HKD family nuclease